MKPLVNQLILIAAGFYLLCGVQTAEAQKLRVGYVHVFDDAPVVIARDKGFFAAEGLDANVTMFTSGPTLVKGLVTD